MYIGDTWADVIGLDRNPARVPVPPRFQADIEELRTRCAEMLADGASEEFSIRRKDMLLRVTTFQSTEGKAVYMIRRPNATILPVRQMGFGAEAIKFMLEPDLRGLVLFSGEMRSGKTSAAASFTRARMETHGGTGIVIEDPPETALDGVMGLGRVIQVEVNRTGGYQAQLKKAMRSGANLIYLGEVRDQEAAAQVVTAAINGHLIVSTMHAATAKDAVIRLVALCEGALSEPEKLLASGLAAVIHLQLKDEPLATATGTKVVKRLGYQMLRVKGHNQVENIIRGKSFHQLDNAMDVQAAKLRSGTFG
nr:ATPase, T2SS/T4P/T4SS family [Ralstonia sp. ASV6]